MPVDFHLIKRAQDGDKAAFDQIVGEYRKRILGIIARLIHCREDVEEVSQEAFLRLYLSLSKLHSAEVFESCLYRLTANAASDYLRKKRRRLNFPVSRLSARQVPRAETEDGDWIDREQHRGKLIQTVDKLLGAVSKKDRILLILNEVELLTVSELGKIYRTDASALGVRVFRARRRVLNALHLSLCGGSDSGRVSLSESVPPECPRQRSRGADDGYIVGR